MIAVISFNEWMRRFLLLPEQASTVAARLDHLHYFVILTTFACSAGVFFMTGYFVVRYRRRSEFQTTEEYHSPIWLKGVYIVGPLVLFLLWFFMGFARYIQLEIPPEGCMSVYVVAKQWMWKFTYPGGPNSISVLTVPAGKPIRLLITSRDVVHSFFVPAFRIKQDAVPGRYTQAWFQTVSAGRWRIFCSEYCGLKHSQMLGEVVALKPSDYEKWLDDQRIGRVTLRDASESPIEADLPRGKLMPGPSVTAPGPYVPRSLPAGDLAEQGRIVAAQKGCFKCHTIDGTRHIGPTWFGLYMKRVQLRGGGTVIADDAYLTQSMMDPDAKIVAGYKPVMPSFQGHLTAPEVAGLVEYIKSLRPGSRLESDVQEDQNGPVR